MGDKPLSFFPSEKRRVAKRPPVSRHIQPSVDGGQARLGAMFHATEGTGLLRSPLRVRVDRHPRGNTRARAGAALAAIVVLTVAGATVLRPASSAPPAISTSAAPPTPQPLRVVETAVAPSAPLIEAPAVAPRPPSPVAPPATRVVSRPSVAVAAKPSAAVNPRRPAAIAPPPASSTGAVAKAPLFTGTLIVDSVPRGATVLINQRPAGTTPLQMTDYAVGSYAVWVELDGFQRWTAGVRVAADTITRLGPTLLPRSGGAGTDR